ncbi:lysosomal alpha-mannosidase-like [Uranotaenia lowii]|uniref:lysosomal alpha-mannosidase-like n=1 Tax=Uranotaenia lowii TaxID=190385 RepID=UPI00247A0D2F|nr:lysosomal alpha-mannosidase-like [Uranotaenia lowii]
MWNSMTPFAIILVSFALLGTISARPGKHHGSGFLMDSSIHHWNHFQVREQHKCGYESCPAPQQDMLNVHLVPHSHDDVGWLKTVDQYYYGSKINHQRAGVQYILDSVVQELLKDPSRRFIQVETAFFFMWWDEQTEEVKDQVRMLVQEGRFEFVGGAWSMNDEAAVHYQSVIDQFTWGLRLLNDTFGECGRPRAGWQIDPFGHSREQASIFAQMGYDGTFFARLDWRDKTKRLEEKKAEMIWKSSVNLDDSELFTSVLYNHYSAPPGFCFDVLCNDDAFVDGQYSAENNVKEKIDQFVNFVTNMSQRYRSNNLIITMGDDFNYMDAIMNYKNMDKLIKYTNARQKEGSKINVFYSTPTCYLKAVHDAQLTWPAKTDDFFPYATDWHAYWTGYFTSRPNSKRFERMGNHFLQVCKQLSAISVLRGESYNEHRLTKLREAIGVMQHHDAITGTEKQHVSDDYHRMLTAAFAGCEANANDVLGSLTRKLDTVTPLTFESCLQLNISQCYATEKNEAFVVTLYNSLGHSTSEYVRVPVNGNNYAVRDDQGAKLPIDIVPVPKAVFDLEYRQAIAASELVFFAQQIPPMGYKSFYVSEVYESESSNDVEQLTRPHITTIGNENLRLNFDENGFLASILVGGEVHNVKQDFLYYEGAYGNNAVFENRSSGAYIFRPNGTEKHVAEKVQISVIYGNQVQEVHQVFNDWISQVIRVYEGDSHVEFEWLVGPIPIDDDKGKEIISRFYTDIASQGTFYTDSNGREMLKRVRDYRETWDLELLEPVAGNYYPITAKIAMEDEKSRIAVLNDRAQGGTSLEDGVLELMVHRRLLRDDAFGVGEALNETAYGKGVVARGKHYLMIGSKKTQTEDKERFLQNQILTPAWTFFSDATKISYEQWQSNYEPFMSIFKESLPLSVNLLTFEPWKAPNTFLIRLEHLLEKGESTLYSTPITVDLEAVFSSNVHITNLRETTLAGNQWKEDNTRLQFFYDPEPIQHTEHVQRPSKIEEGFQVTLNPMEIRTFIIEIHQH